MSTEQATRQMPKDDDVKIVGAKSSWRFSKGQIVTGREVDATLQTRPRIAGYLARVGIYKGVTNDEFKKPYEQLEADIETADGMVYVKASLIDPDEPGVRKISRSVLDFAWGLLQFPTANDDALMITTAQGDAWTNDKGKTMSGSTYVNFFRVDEKMNAHPLYKPKRVEGAPKVEMNDQFMPLEEQIRKHPLFGERPESRTDEHDEDESATHLKLFCRECAAKGWPTPEQTPTEWLAMMAKNFKHDPRASLSGYDDDDWGAIRLALKDQSKMPGPLEAAAAKLKESAAEPGDPEEKSPFD